MEEEILAIARAIVGAAEEEETYLAALCRAEQTRLAQRLQTPLCEENRGAFICAVAWMAAADYYSGKGAGGASWKAGDVSVENPSAEAYAAAAENLRRAARSLGAGLLEDDGFLFLGVWG